MYPATYPGPTGPADPRRAPAPIPFPAHCLPVAPFAQPPGELGVAAAPQAVAADAALAAARRLAEEAREKQEESRELGVSAPSRVDALAAARTAAQQTPNPADEAKASDEKQEELGGPDFRLGQIPAGQGDQV